MTIAEDTFVEQYQQEGYALVRGMFAHADLEPLRRVLSRGVDAHARKLHAEGKIPELYEHLDFEHRLAAMFAGRESAMRSWDDIAISPELFHLITHPGLLDLVESLIGPEVTFNGGFHIRPKLPESALAAFPWHQDSQYYGEPTKNMHIVTVSIPLVDLTEDNGCLWMIPGSQKWGYLPGARGVDQNFRTFDDVEQRGQPIPIPMRCGDAMVFHNLTFHASTLNRTTGVRWTLDMRYAPSRPSRQEQGMSPGEAAGYDYFIPKIHAMGLRTANVRTRNGQTTTYQQWLGRE